MALRNNRALKAQKSRSVVKTLPAPTGGWNARDALSAMPEEDAVALVNFFPQTTDVLLRYGSQLWASLASSVGAGNALLLDGSTGYATTPDSASIDVTGDIDLRAYANLDNWTSGTQFFISKGTPGTDSSYQLFIISGRLGAILYTAAGVIAGAFQSDVESVFPGVNGSPLWVRFTCDIDNGVGFSVGKFYTSSDGTTWTQLGGNVIQLSFASIANSAVALDLGRGDYPASVTYNNPPLLTCDSAQFDGTNDYMTRGAGLTGASDSKTGIVSFWIRFDGTTGVNQSIFTSFPPAGPFSLSWIAGGAGTLTIVGRNTTGDIRLQFDTISTFSPGTTWYNILASWNLAVAGSGRLYINDVSNRVDTVYTDATIAYSNTTNWRFGASISAGNILNACLAEFYFATGQYLDFSITTNRRKFISASGKPVHLGSDGSLPTGTAPLVYQHLAAAEAPANFALNRATGGNFTITGTLTTGSTSPST